MIFDLRTHAKPNWMAKCVRAKPLGRAARILSASLALAMVIGLASTDVAEAHDLRVLTWNSTGEAPPREDELRDEINRLNAMYPGTPTAVVLNQEGLNGAGGNIYNMLNNAAAPPASIGPNYLRPPSHLTEMLNGGGAGYNILFGNNLVVTQAPALYDYAADAAFNAWVAATFAPAVQVQVWQEIGQWRPPVVMQLQNAAGEVIRLVTWHAPLAVSQVLNMCAQPAGGAPLDAYLFLAASSILQNTAGVDIVVVAGDLNMTRADLQAVCNTGAGPFRPLENFTGVSSNLDHILAWLPNAGGAAPTYHEDVRTQSPYSVHDLYSARINW